LKQNFYRLSVHPILYEYTVTSFVFNEMNGATLDFLYNQKLLHNLTRLSNKNILHSKNALVNIFFSNLGKV